MDATGYVVNYDAFHESYPVAIPLCSAQTLERRRLFRELNLQYSDNDSLEDIEYSTGVPDSRRQRDEGTTDAEGTMPTEHEDKEKRLATEESPQSREEEQKDVNAERVEAPSTKDSSGDGTNATAKERVRKISRVEFQPLPGKAAGTNPQRRLSLGDAVNMYRHRRSVTDTYLGTELPEEESDDSEQSAAILSLRSLHSWGHQERRPDVRDVFKQRRKSTTLELMFGTEGVDTDGESG